MDAVIVQKFDRKHLHGNMGNEHHKGVSRGNERHKGLTHGKPTSGGTTPQSTVATSSPSRADQSKPVHNSSSCDKGKNRPLSIHSVDTSKADPSLDNGHNSIIPSEMTRELSSQTGDPDAKLDAVGQKVAKQQQPSESKQTTVPLTTIPQLTLSECATVSDSPVKSSSTTEKTTVKVSPNPRYDLGFLSDLQSKYKFTTAVCKQNEVAQTAIQSLDCLNDQIVQYIVSSQNSANKDDTDPVSNETVQSSMVIIRRLLLDAQSRFRKMVEDNKQLASHIDTSIQAANQEVNMLRAELASTNKRLSQISVQDENGKKERATQTDRSLSSSPQKSPEKSDSDKEDAETTVQTLTRENAQLVEDYKHLIEDHDVLKCSHEEMKQANESLKMENTRLQGQLEALRKEYDDLRQVKDEGATGDHKPSYGELKLELIQTRQELSRAKEVLQGMKSDRKRLKGEKLDLLSQMKQLYTTLEEKETELRDFIKNYEQRVKESDDMIKQLAKEKEDLVQEKWEIVTKAKEAAERAMFLKAQCDTKDQNMKDMESELKETKDKLSTHESQKNSITSSITTASDGNIHDEEVFVDDLGFSTAEESSVLNSTFTQEVDTAPQQILSVSPASTTDSLDSAAGPMFRWFTQSSDFEIPLEAKPSKKKRKNFSSLSRVFSRGRLRRSIALPHAESLMADEASPRLCVLSQDNYQEKLNTIERMVGVDMKEWRAHQVLAWLEITLAMPMYAQNCLLNVKSGQILLGLSDNELSAALGVTNPMHRRKLRIAIEQHRNPDEIKYLKASEMDPTWIAHRLLPDLGLPQYTDVFEEQLCDGHVLNTLTRRDLEKHFAVHRKFHQSSILHAVELLRRIDFNKEKLYHRRNMSEEKDADLIVWTNERLMKWLRSIDLGEYCESLVESGVHGALMVLEPSFNAESLAAILGIAPSKSYIRRHLTTELDKILKPARAALDTAESHENGSSSKNKSRKSSQDRGQKVFEDKGRRKSEEEGRSRLSFRGSFGRAFGKKVRDDLKMFDSDSSRKKISAPIPIQHSSLSALDSESELIRKGFCVKTSQRHSSYGPQGDPIINGILTQNLRQKYMAQSDQALHRSLDLQVIREKDINAQTNEEFTQGKNSLSSGNIGCVAQHSSEKTSAASSQETLTDQTSDHRKSINTRGDIVTLQNEIIVHQHVPESFLQSSNIIKTKGENEHLLKSQDSKISSTNHTQKVVDSHQIMNSSSDSGYQVARDLASENRPIGVKGHIKAGSGRDRKCGPKKRGSIQDVFPQTTSV